MLDTKHDPERYAEWLAHIESADTKEAFCFMVGLAACARSVVCHPQFKGAQGPIRDFRFLDQQTSAQAFSFITNRNSLLFYFRKPAVTSGLYEFEALRLASPRASINTRGEWTVPLATIEDVRRLWKSILAARGAARARAGRRTCGDSFFKRPFFLPRGTPNTAPDALGSVFEGG